MTNPITPLSAVTPLPLEPGHTLTLAGDPNPWTVKAVSEHFMALSRNHFDSMGEVFDMKCSLFTVLDWRNGVRGPCDLSGQAWRDGTCSEAEYAAMLAGLEFGDLEISHRNRVRIEFGEVAW